MVINYIKQKRRNQMKLGDVMLAVICGLVITVSVFHISFNNSSSQPQVEHKSN